jgi:methionine synthase I (cobalamin-dependent)
LWEVTLCHWCVVSDVLKDCNAFKTLGTTHLTQLNILEDLNLHHHRYKNLDCHSNSIIVPVHILAGADVLKTNTYQASTGGFIKYLGLSTEESYQLIKTAVNLAKSACLFHATEVGSTAGLLVKSTYN